MTHPVQLLYLIILAGSLIKVERKIVNTILWQLLSSILQTPVFDKEFGLFVRNASNKLFSDRLRFRLSLLD